MAAVSFFPVEETSKLAALMGVEAEVQTLLDAQNYDKVYSLFAKKSGALLTQGDYAANPKDLEKVYNLLIAIVSQAKQDDLPDLVPAIVAPLLTDDATNLPIQKLQVLSNLFNSLDAASHIRYLVFVAVVQLAYKADEIDVILPTLPLLNSYFTAWGVEQDEERSLILLLSEVLADKFPAQAYEYLLQYLRTFPSKPFPKQVQETAAQAVETALTLPAVTNFVDLARLAPVASLKSSHANLLSLVQIFVDGNVSAFDKFLSEHPKFLSEHPSFDESALRTKIRLLTLATLAYPFVDVADGLSFANVAKALNVDLVDVEEWVVTAIRSGLIDGRIDQVNKVVRVSRATQRVFGPEQWNMLEERLSSWSDNLKHILQVLHNAKTAVGQASA
ncbi:hypothetical protein HK100_006167 [Physocladia obscura]|uniref:Eukaryotic translation initiation factor 3 subunit M n=1 Tax=Physocladia obscura TaxID=109957 RepID=A0AAD5T819_9FUNG|nr:hypothetical protein HK100_006167 [Physocladia obscura]